MSILQQLRLGLRVQSNVSATAWPEVIKGSWNRGHKLLTKARCLLAIIFLYACLVGNATAQVKFIQLTDPHLFDSEDDMSRNREVLIDAVGKINELNKINNYAFVVVTGDIGIEQIVKAETPPETKDRIDEGARMMANILASSEVRVWLLVPGNNDLKDEEFDTIGYYHQFVDTLRDTLVRSEIRVIDLCPKQSPQPYIAGGKHEYAFIGFNNASFKNNNDATRLRSGVEDCCAEVDKCSRAGQIRCAQQAEIRKVSDLLENNNPRFAYLFYHIPEVNDPYLLRKDADSPLDKKLPKFHANRVKRRDVTGAQYLDSSWFIDEALRSDWRKVTGAENVMGLFAGHLHDPRPELYLSYRGNNENPKLYICPPLAIKLQGKEKVQARGFQEVSIDEGRDPTSLIGEVNTTIYWYVGATRLFSTSSAQPKTSPSPSPSPTPPPEKEFMTWEKAAHIFTVLQLFLVAISVFFIWWQLKKQTDLARVANTQALVALSSPFNLEVARNRDMAAIWFKGPREFDKLNEVEQYQYRRMLIWWLIFYENVFFQAKSRLLDQTISSAWKKDIEYFVRGHLVEAHWSDLKEKYHPEFVQYIDSLIRAKTGSG